MQLKNNMVSIDTEKYYLDNLPLLLSIFQIVIDEN